MNATVRLQEPVVLDNRKIYPVVAEVTTTMDHGMMGSLFPIALIIEEDGKLSCALLEGESLLAVLEKLACPVL